MRHFILDHACGPRAVLRMPFLKRARLAVLETTFYHPLFVNFNFAYGIFSPIYFSSFYFYFYYSLDIDILVFVKGNYLISI